MAKLWEFPSKEVVLENEAVHITAVNMQIDLVALFWAASFENNETDQFQYHVNVPTMTELPIFEKYLSQKLKKSNEVVYKVFSKRMNCLVGCASLMNIQPEHGTLEIGSIWYCRNAQRTEINTNSMYLLFSYVFEDLKYRRLEWKCNTKNLASMNTATRLGFEYEGTFRQHFVSRGENRDTAWYSIIDSEWKEKERALQNNMIKA
ncbi:MAG: GNAT family N-acetyltransferase [Bdellovibrionales bacterium]|nr:GNAT family N-acetyltransferase [Bdellovibrionales bacterium]